MMWTEHLQKTLIDAGAIPLSGYAPEFPWKALAEKISALLEGAPFDLALHKMEIVQSEGIASGFGDDYLSVGLEMTPLSGTFFWIMEKQEATRLASLCLSSAEKLVQPKLQEGFYYYLITEVVQTLNGLHPFGDLKLKITKTGELSREEALCIDVQISFSEQTFWGRVICPSSFHHHFKQHFITPDPGLLSTALAKNIPLTLHLEVGRTELSTAEWESVQVGDLVILDQCSFDPRTHKGYVTLVVGTTALVRGRIKESVLKIVDYAIYRQEEFMDTHHPEESDTEDMGNETEHLWSDEQASVEPLLSAEKIPIILSVEVAKLTMHLDQVLQLKPGNVLELPVKPEQGVDVSINGRVVAKAELVKVGEMLGIKILSLGK